MVQIRNFVDLINEIEIDGEKFIPIQKIAALAFNYNDNCVKNNFNVWINNSYDFAIYYTFETNILKPKKHLCKVMIFRNYDICTYIEIDNKKSESNIGIPACNQIEIFNNLRKWNFIN